MGPPKPPLVAAPPPAPKDHPAGEATLGIPWRGGIIVGGIALLVLGDAETILGTINSVQAQLVVLCRMLAKSVPREWHAKVALMMLLLGMVLSLRFLRYETRMVSLPNERSTTHQF